MKNYQRKCKSLNNKDVNVKESERDREVIKGFYEEEKNLAFCEKISNQQGHIKNDLVYKHHAKVYDFQRYCVSKKVT